MAAMLAADRVAVKTDDLSRVDYAAVERALTPALRDALTDCCELLGIPRAKWAQLSTLTTLFQTVAMQQLALTFKASGLSWTLALQRAADQLGVNASSHHRLLRRWI